MCGIVGLLVKNQSMRANIGQLMMPMLIGMTERGPDSAGMAVFTSPVDANALKYSLYAPTADFSWKTLERDFNSEHSDQVTLAVKGNHAILTSAVDTVKVKSWIKQAYPQIHILSVGQSIDVYKDTGLPADVAARYDLPALSGTHLVGHTRMATESAITPAHAHPFTAGTDWCLVHNGSLSNPNSLRRKLQHEGINFETDNDTEAACRFLEWRMREGDDLKTALEHGFDELDGFYTLLMGTKDQLALVRDPFACKPAVVAEHDDYVAIASEFRSLAHLPDVKNAHVFEPSPKEMYVWKV
ncbi:class II glutamine amidotransferase [Methylophilus sp. 3sh_L]|uniref:class II glutamine amidotransferase n=1 Tax=Methylophilus sp. 3sh_L TaxID=3377114 RepID=UPI00398F3CE7